MANGLQYKSACTGFGLAERESESQKQFSIFMPSPITEYGYLVTFGLMA